MTQPSAKLSAKLSARAVRLAAFWRFSVPICQIQRNPLIVAIDYAQLLIEGAA